MADTPEPFGRPLYEMLSCSDAKDQVVALITEIGGEEFDRRMKAEIREAMDEMGVRVVLWYGERMDNVSAVMEEFLP